MNCFQDSTISNSERHLKDVKVKTHDMFRRVSLNVDSQAIVGIRREKGDVNGIKLIRRAKEAKVSALDGATATR